MSSSKIRVNIESKQLRSRKIDYTKGPEQQPQENTITEWVLILWIRIWIIILLAIITVPFVVCEIMKTRDMRRTWESYLKKEREQDRQNSSEKVKLLEG